MTAAELDAIASRYEREWGPGRLPLLVSQATATRWHAALDLLTAEWPPAGQTWETVRASIARGWAALAAEATARGHAPLAPACFEAEWAPGRRFAIASDELHRHAIEARNKAEGREVSVWTVAEVAALIAEIPICAAVKEQFPNAVARPVSRGPVPADEIPFGGAEVAA